MKSDVVVKLEDFLLLDADCGAGLVILRIAVGHQSTESVVTAGQLKHDGDTLIGLCFRSRQSGPDEMVRQDGTHPDQAEAAGQEIPACVDIELGHGFLLSS